MNPDRTHAEAWNGISWEKHEARKAAERVRRVIAVDDEVQVQIGPRRGRVLRPAGGAVRLAAKVRPIRLSMPGLGWILPALPLLVLSPVR